MFAIANKTSLDEILLNQALAAPPPPPPPPQLLCQGIINKAMYTYSTTASLIYGCEIANKSHT